MIIRLIKSRRSIRNISHLSMTGRELAIRTIDYNTTLDLVDCIRMICVCTWYSCVYRARERGTRRSNRGINESTWYHVDASIVNEPLIIVRCRARRTTAQKSAALDHAKGVNALTSCSCRVDRKAFALELQRSSKRIFLLPPVSFSFCKTLSFY